MNHGNNSKAFKALVSTSSQDYEPSNKARKDKKKKQHKNKKDSRDFTTLAIGINMAKVRNKKKRKKKNMNEVMCFNYDKKGHLQTSVRSFGSQKTSDSLGNLHAGDCS